MRAFLALDINDEVRQHLEEIQGAIKLTNRGKGTWSHPENFHLSLAFLDEITKDQADILARLLKQEAKNHGKFELTLGHLGYFQDESSATVWCSVNPDNRLKALVSDVYQAVKDSRIHFDNKPFKAHITLGRKINIMNCRLSSLQLKSLTFPVEGITLYKSTLTPTGPIYTPIEFIELS